MSQDQQVPSIDDLRAFVNQMLDGLDPTSPIGATVVFKVHPDHQGTFEANADALTEETRKLPGLNLFNYHPHLPIFPEEGHGLEYVIYEDWKTVQFFRAQWDSGHLQSFQHSVGALLVEGTLPDLRFYHGSETAGNSAPVLRTGQRRCYDQAGNVVPCAGTGQDGEVRAGAGVPPRFHDNGDGTVLDTLTGLTWLKDADCFGEVTWAQALANANNLDSGTGGLTDGSKRGDWRLPNIRELRSILDSSTAAPMIPEGHPFENVQSAIYWASTTLASAPTLAWMTTFGIGPSVFDLKINSSRMWPVKGQGRIQQTGQKQCWDTDGNEINCGGTGQDGDLQTGIVPPSPRFTDNGDGTVRDNLTGLVWLKNANAFGFKNWVESIEVCNALASGSHGLTDGSKAGDWRLPNINEIESLIDYGTFGPCLPDRGHPFEGVRPSSYWTSTTVAGAPSEAMFTILGVGPSIFESKEHPFFVWPVRD